MPKGGPGVREGGNPDRLVNDRRHGPVPEKGIRHRYPYFAERDEAPALRGPGPSGSWEPKGSPTRALGTNGPDRLWGEHKAGRGHPAQVFSWAGGNRVAPEA